MYKIQYNAFCVQYTNLKNQTERHPYFMMFYLIPHSILYLILHVYFYLCFSMFQSIFNLSIILNITLSKPISSLLLLYTVISAFIPSSSLLASRIG